MVKEKKIEPINKFDQIGERVIKARHINRLFTKILKYGLIAIGVTCAVLYFIAIAKLFIMLICATD